MITIDEPRHIVAVNKTPIRLTPKEWSLLLVLAKAKGHVLSRVQITNSVWGPDYNDIKTRSVDQHISRLRRKLGKYGDSLRTVTSFGYQLFEPVTFMKS